MVIVIIVMVVMTAIALSHFMNMDDISIVAGASVLFLQTEYWFGMLKHADVILDSYPFGGYTTTLEAWAVGNAPIVTMPHTVYC